MSTKNQIQAPGALGELPAPSCSAVDRVAKVEQADGKSTHPNGYHKFLKRKKVRLERRRAKENPECIPAYNRYQGYET